MHAAEPRTDYPPADWREVLLCPFNSESFATGLIDWLVDRALADEEGRARQ